MKNMKLIAYLDSVVYAPADPTNNVTSNSYYNDGNSFNAFIKTSMFKADNSTYNNNLISINANNQTCAYVDWFNFDNTGIYWKQVLEQYYNNAQFDGLWTSGNEPFSAIQGESDPRIQRLSLKQGGNVTN